MRLRRLANTAPAALLAVLLALTGCSDDGDGQAGSAGEADQPDDADGRGDDTVDELPAACAEPPLTMALEAFGAQPAGSSDFEVADAVVRRVPVLTGVEGTASDPAELAELQARAAESPIAVYSLYVADFVIDRSELEGFGFGEVTPTTDGTVGTITIVSPTEEGLTVGDIIDQDTRIAYETTTTLAPLGLTVATATRSGHDPYFDLGGGVEVLAIDDDQLCLSMNVTFVDVGGEPVSSVRGAILAPIVHAPPSFFYT